MHVQVMVSTMKFIWTLGLGWAKLEEVDEAIPGKDVLGALTGLHGTCTASDA